MRAAAIDLVTTVAGSQVYPLAMGKYYTYNGWYKVGQPPVGPSEGVQHCYAILGLGLVTPQINSAIRILAINAARQTQWVDAYYCSYKGFVCEALRGEEWRLLGYVQTDRSLPLGPLEAVDPLLAQFDRLPWCNSSAAPSMTPAATAVVNP